MRLLILAFLILIIVIIGSLFSTRIYAKNTDITLGPEKDHSLLSKDIKWTPDGHITYVTFKDNSRRYFISGNQKTYTIDASASLSLDQVLTENFIINENFGSDITISYRNHYSTVNSVIQTDPNNLDHLMAFTQNEEQIKKADGSFDKINFTATIGLLESYDRGTTWNDFGPIIKGDDYLTPGTKITGAGEPSAVVNNGYIYIYFIDWAAGINSKHADQIYLARTKIFNDGGLGEFEYLNTNGFSANISKLQPVISADIKSGFTALPSISYNKYLDKYLAVYETNQGFNQAVSDDGINWKNQKLLLGFEKPLSTRATGDTWISYPTLLSDNTDNSDGTTGNYGYLYYGKGIWPNTAHQLTVRSFEFK